MKTFAVLAISVLLIGCASRRGDVFIEQAAAGKPYDFVVHVKNVAEYRYNPQVSSDRAEMALHSVKRECPGGRVVGQQTINTEIYGITSSKPDYVVLVRCS
jgi:hypothetical protein